MLGVVKKAWSTPVGKRLMILTAFIAVLASLATGSYISNAQAEEQAPGQTDLYAKALGAALAVGLAGIGGGIAVGIAGAAAISAVSEKREMSGIALLYVVLGEGIAIYGLLVSLIILFVL